MIWRPGNPSFWGLLAKQLGEDVWTEVCWVVMDTEDGVGDILTVSETGVEPED
ncbi:MAG TPA: hypothetical protein V6D34_10715 [Candidatus Sericytochromatia bacterium]|jgi:hypothetical protein